MSLLPSSPDVSPDSDPRLVGLDSDEADELMAALSSETARRLLAELHEDPAPPGELADRVDTSLQNAQYHLEKLEGAGAIEGVGTAYSEKGREMTVYGPADSPLVIYAGEQERASGLRAALSRLFGGVLALGIVSLAIQELFGRSIFRAARDDAGPQGAPPSETPTATPPPGGDDDGAQDANGDGKTLDSEATEEPTDAESVNISAGENGTATPEPQQTGDDGATATATEAENMTIRDAGTATPEPDATPEPAGTPIDEQATTETQTEAATPAADGGTAGSPTETPVGAPMDTPTATETGGGAGPLNLLDGLLDGLLAGGLPPGLAFFVGGLTVLSVFVAMTYLRARP